MRSWLYTWVFWMCKWNGACLSIEHVCSRLVYLQILSELKQCRLPWIQEPLSAEDQQGRQSRGWMKGGGEKNLSFNMWVGREEEFMVWIWGWLFWAIELLILDPEPLNRNERWESEKEGGEGKIWGWVVFCPSQLQKPFGGRDWSEWSSFLETVL